MRMLLREIVVGVVLVLLSACDVPNNQTPQPPATLTALPGPPPSQTLALTATSTVKISPTVIPQPALDFPAIEVSHSILLSTGLSITCQLPCWQGLHIGESKQSEVEDVLREVFHAPTGYDFFAISGEEDGLLTLLLDVKNNHGGGHRWYFEKEGIAGVYYFYAFIDSATGRLTGFKERMFSFYVYEVPSLPEVLGRLGRPAWVYGSGSGSVYVVSLFYEQGIVAYVTIPKQKNQNNKINSVCFDSEPLDLNVALVDPYDSINEKDLSPMQRSVGAPHDRAPYIDKELGPSIEDFMMFVEGKNHCIQVPR